MDSLDHRARYDLAQFGGAMGDPSRAAMLVGLVGGVALPASDLARLAKVTPSTASGHLRILVDAGLVIVKPQGRHRYFTLAGPEVAEVVEHVLVISGRSRPPKPGSLDPALVLARTCYGHLAGKVAVAFWDRATKARWVRWSGDSVALLARGREALASRELMTSTGALAAGKRCLDWTERVAHVSGPLGTAICSSLFDRGWAKRVPGGRTLRLTERGLAGFAALGVRWQR